MAALLESKRLRADLRFVVFYVPCLLGADLRGLSWQERRERLELLAQAFDVPLELSPLVEPSVALVEQMTNGRLRGDRPQGSDVDLPRRLTGGVDEGEGPQLYERDAWRFDRR